MASRKCYLCQKRLDRNKDKILRMVMTEPNYINDEDMTDFYVGRFTLYFCTQCFEMIAGKDYIDLIKNKGEKI
jgi:hypothetical protein